MRNSLRQCKPDDRQTAFDPAQMGVAIQRGPLDLLTLWAPEAVSAEKMNLTITVERCSCCAQNHANSLCVLPVLE